MLVIRKYRENEEKEIERLLIQEEIEDLGISDLIYVILEDDTIIGACKIQIDDEKGLLKYLVIKSDSRGENLGEGLLRGVLNKLDNEGIRNVYFNGMNLYLLYKGFVENNENKLELNVSEFFLEGCPSSRGSK